MKAGNGGGSIDYTARSWPDLGLPTDATKRTDGRTAMRYRCCIERREVSCSLWSCRKERKSYGILGQIHSGTSGRGTLRRFFCVPHSDHVAHRVGFCLLSLPWSTCNTNRRFIPFRFGDFPVKGRFIASVRCVTFKNGLILELDWTDLLFNWIKMRSRKVSKRGREYRWNI